MFLYFLLKFILKMSSGSQGQNQLHGILVIALPPSGTVSEMVVL